VVVVVVDPCLDLDLDFGLVVEVVVDPPVAESAVVVVVVVGPPV
jgi:hypothetical protein